jgi:hypothetical protein
MTNLIIDNKLSAARVWLNAVRLDTHGFIFALKKKQPVSLTFNSHDDALIEINTLIEDGCDVFVGIGNVQPESTRRIAENVTELSAIFIDLDCGANKPYSSQKEALDDLIEAVTSSGFPKPSLVVDSGGGIHAYWCFIKPIIKDDWLTLATDFKSFWMNAGLKIDPVVTADCARVMRVPDSYNHKLTDHPRLVSLLIPQAGKSVRQYDVADIRSALPAASNLPTVLSLGNKPNYLPPFKDGITQNDASARLMLPLCKQVEVAINTGGATRTEPEWHADLGLLKYTIEAPFILHTASDKHPGYSAIETNDKALNWTASPTTCEHYYKKLASPLCDGCGYKGKLTSPIQLGYPTPRGLNAVVLNTASTTQPSSIIPPPAYLSAPTEIRAVSEKFAWDREAMNLYNITTGRYVQKERFNTHYANRFIDLGTATKPKPVALGVAWIQHHLRREANGVRMVPNEPEDLPDGAINSWLGFSVEPIEGDINPFIKLFERQITNPSDRKYVLHWIANLFQNPASTAFTSIVMWSRTQGTGKNLLWECVGNLFNERHFTLVSQEVFDDAFTEWKANRVFVICDEVSSTEKRQTADRIKGWITSSSNAINTKNEPKFNQPNLIKYVFLSNHPDAVFLDDSDRRFFVVEVAQGRLPDNEAREFTSWRDNGGQQALLHFLLNLGIGEFNAKSPAPMSSAKQEMIDDNMSDVERWFEHLLLNIQSIIGRDICSAEELQKAYYEASDKSKCSTKTITVMLRKKGIKRLTKQAKLPNGKRIRVYALREFQKYEEKIDKELGDIMDTNTCWFIQ